MIKRALIFVICIVLSGVICWIASAVITTRSLHSQFAALELSEIAQDARAGNVLSGVIGADNEEFDKIFFPNLVTIAIFRPELSKLSSVQLGVLCRLIVYRQNGGFSGVKSPLKEMVFNFLDSQKNPVFKHFSNSQRDIEKARKDLVTEHVISPEYLEKIRGRARATAATSNLCTR